MRARVFFSNCESISPADHALTLGQAGLDLAPGIYQTAVAPGFPPVGVGPTLVGGENVTLAFDSPGPQQHLPVGGAGDGGECRGYHYKLGTLVAQRQVELGKAHIVTDGQRSEERRVGKECRSRWWPDE